ncbi:MAG: protein kinase [Nanoarchaeota archaeon]|nr:protein kinase [Nanoarchaeota archaeon]
MEYQDITPFTVGSYFVAGWFPTTSLYVGLDKETLEKVVLKASDLRHVVNPNENALDMSKVILEREKSLMDKLDHKYICPAIEVVKGEEDDVDFLVMPYLSNTTLNDWLVHDAKQVKFLYLGHVAEALEHAHSREIMHRDIKPTNIAVNGHGTLFDWGNGYELSRPWVVGDYGRGTYNFMSPEQVSIMQPTPEQDVFGFCVTAYVMLTTHFPYRATARGSDFRQFDARGQELEGTGDFAKLCIKGLNIDPAKRPCISLLKEACYEAATQ